MSPALKAMVTRMVIWTNMETTSDIVAEPTTIQVAEGLDKMFRESKFNVCYHNDNERIIFNSLRNTFSIVPDDADLANDEYFQAFALEQGLIVDEDTDEEKFAFIKYVKTIEDGTLHLTIMPTMSCNFRCSYCYEDHIVSRMSDDVISGIINFVRKYIHNVDKVLVSWFGGEPTLCADIVERISEELIKVCKFYRKSYVANMTTNGYLLDDKMMKKFIGLHITNFQITLDGSREEHDKIRCLANGKGSYDAIVNNLKSIRDNVKNPLFRIMLRINVTKETIEKFDEVIDEYEQFFGGDQRFTYLFRRVGDWGGNEVRKIEEQLIDDENILIRKLLDYKGRLRINNQTTEFTGSYGVCYAGKSHAYVVNYDGKVMKCTVNLDDPCNNIGTLRSDGVIEETGNAAKWLFCGGYTASRPERCEGCTMWANCFNNTCTAAVIAKGLTSTPVCAHLEDNLKLTYKSFPGMFKTIDTKVMI